MIQNSETGNSIEFKNTWHSWNFWRGQTPWNLLLVRLVRTRRNSTPSWMRQGQHFKTFCIWQRRVVSICIWAMIGNEMKWYDPEKGSDDHDPWWESAEFLLTHIIHHYASIIFICACLLHTSHLRRKRWPGAMFHALSLVGDHFFAQTRGANGPTEVVVLRSGTCGMLENLRF